MNENPMFSVIVPTFNRSKLLRRAIQSVFQQTYDNWELIIIDNYSEDNSLEVISSFDQSKIKLLQIKNNGVIGTSRNLGIKNAKGNYLAFLDSDDWWKKNKLQTSLSFFLNCLCFASYSKKIFCNADGISTTERRNNSEFVCLAMITACCKANRD